MSRQRPQTWDEQFYYALPRLTFWYHLSPMAFVQMPRALIQEYLKQLPDLERSYFFNMMQVVTYPHLDEDGRKAVFRAYEPSDDSDDSNDEPEQPTMSKEEFLAKLRDLPIAIEGLE